MDHRFFPTILARTKSLTAITEQQRDIFSLCGCTLNSSKDIWSKKCITEIEREKSTSKHESYPTLIEQ